MNPELTVMVVNAGSHSLQLSQVDNNLRPVRTLTVDAPPDSVEAGNGLNRFLDHTDEVAAVGHRIVHGGPSLAEPIIIDDDVRRRLEGAAFLAPQHLRPALAALDRCRERLTGVAHVACFDTAFHVDLPEPARTYPLPRRWRQDYGLRRYGFHGLSYGWAMDRAAALLDQPADKIQLLLAHLGGGASVCAVRNGTSVSTSMGFTPLEGLMMSTRSGSVDPGMLVWLQRHHGLTVEDISDGLEYHSGLLGLSDELSGDTRDLVAARKEKPAAALALAVFFLRIRQELAAAAMSLERIDALVFTGEIGADQPEVREAVCAGLPLLGIHGGLSTDQDTDRRLSVSGIPVLLVHPREDAQIARHVFSLVGDQCQVRAPPSLGDHI
jgi:acetate kinase